jgi:hypothetical protein
MDYVINTGSVEAGAAIDDVGTNSRSNLFVDNRPKAARDYSPARGPPKNMST